MMSKFLLRHYLGLTLGVCVLASCSAHDRVETRADKGTVAPERTRQASAALSGPAIGDFVLYAERSVSIGASDIVAFGDVGVHSAAPSSFGPQLNVGSLSTVPVTLFAPSVTLGFDAQVGEVEAITVQNNGGFFAGQSPFPGSAMPLLPIGAPVKPGPANVTVAAGTTLALPPGNYGAADIAGELDLSPGVYSFASVTLEQGASFLSSAGAADVRVAGQFSAGQGTLTQGSTADMLTLSVLGADVSGAPTPAALSVGQGSQITGLVAVPHGTLAIGDQVVAAGAFAAYDITVGMQCNVSFQVGFPASASGQGGRSSVPISVPGAQATAPLVGPMPANAILHFGLELPLQHTAAWGALVQQLYDPTSPQYRQFLSPDQFAASFGATTMQYQQLVSFAQAARLTVDMQFGSNLFLVVSGPASAIENAFLVNLNYYQRPDGGVFFASDRTPSVDPTSMSLLPDRIIGFNNFNVPHNELAKVPPGSFTGDNIGSGPNGYLYGNDFRNIYVPDTTLTGTGQTVAIVALDDFYDNDITSYEMGAVPALRAVPLQRVPVMGGAGQVITTGNEEVALDIEMTVAMAPGLDHIFVYEGPASIGSGDLTVAADQMAYDMAIAAILHQIANPPPGVPMSLQVSDSWNHFDGPSNTTTMKQFQTQGQTYLIAGGDYGAYVPGDPFGTIIPPFDDPVVNLMTVVGGTQSNSGTGTTTSCMVETTWNQKLEYPKGAGGGGISSGVSDTALLSTIGPPPGLPPFQTPVLANTQNNGSPTNRNIPDVSALADGILLIADNGMSGGNGGTSAATPLWAGIIALVNQQIGTGKGIGFLNPALYRIAQGANYTKDFHDIKDNSNNNEKGDTAHFQAVTGYDLATGWGSPREGLLDDLASPSPRLPPITFGQITFTIQVGDDDLRCTSEATADLLDAQGNTIANIMLHQAGDPSWDNNTSHTAGPTAFSPAQLRAGIASIRINLRQTGNTCQVFTTGDQWNINGVIAQLSDPSTMATPTILNLSGNPLKILDTNTVNVTFTTIFACP
jgi:hypothetical protein